ncbi:hypothetical protein FRC09_001797 [Ceratobasidium sp. 395]|nr:hypothetical protein FRC09_001797 [Ceratobasidium sp. 395]
MRVHLPVVSFVCTALILIPLPWHWRARNIATVSIIVWLTLVNIPRGINAIVWADTVVVKYPVWCDITSKLVIGANVGLPASTLCICRYLAAVASPRHTIPTASDKRRRMVFELLMTIGLPAIAMILHYIVQGHRFDILEDIGCNPTTYVSVAGLIIVFLPPMVLSLGTLLYAGLAFFWFLRRRAQFQERLQSNQTGLNTGYYFRLIALSVMEMLFSTVMSAYVLAITVRDGGLKPWVSWEHVHSNWLRVGQFAKILLPRSFWSHFWITWYIGPVASLIFFVFFGFGREAKVEYAKAWRWVQRRVFRMQPKPQLSDLPVCARGGLRTMSSTMSTPAMVKLESETSLAAEKWDEAPTSTYTASRPPSPADRSLTTTSEPETSRP